MANASSNQGFKQARGTVGPSSTSQSSVQLENVLLLRHIVSPLTTRVNAGADGSTLAWEDISVTLAKADQSFGHASSWAYNASGGKMSTADGGKTWNFTTLYVPETRPT